MATQSVKIVDGTTTSIQDSGLLSKQMTIATPWVLPQRHPTSQRMQLCQAHKLAETMHWATQILTKKTDRRNVPNNADFNRASGSESVLENNFHSRKLDGGTKSEFSHQDHFWLQDPTRIPPGSCNCWHFWLQDPIRILVRSCQDPTRILHLLALLASGSHQDPIRIPPGSCICDDFWLQDPIRISPGSCICWHFWLQDPTRILDPARNQGHCRCVWKKLCERNLWKKLPEFNDGHAANNQGIT